MPGRILLVDDTASRRFMMRVKLTAAYYDVVEAASGEEALVRARADEPDLILLDVLMPGIDGFETCRRLKSARETAHIPVVILTQLGSQADRVRGIEAGADDFLSHPPDDIQLIARVNGLIRVKMMMDELRVRDDTCLSLGWGGGLPEASDLLAGNGAPAAAHLLMVGAPDALPTAPEVLYSGLGAEIQIAGSLTEALAAAAETPFDAFLIGHRLAEGEPIRLAALLRSRPGTRAAPIVMIFRPEQIELAHRAMEMGVADSLGCPADPAELVARLRVQLRRKHYSDRLRAAMRENMVAAVTDPLTGLYNRRYAALQVSAMAARADAGGNRLVAMLLDLDRFKAVNDRLGHAAGDAVLVEFARRLRANVRAFDLVARIGGEEFLVVMPDVAPDFASQVAERVRAAVEAPEFEAAGQPLPVTVSIGMTIGQPGEEAETLIARADAALYASKAAGRNRVTWAEAA